MTRARAASACLAVALVATAIGAYLLWGVGGALLLAGAMLYATGVLLGWEA